MVKNGAPIKSIHNAGFQNTPFLNRTHNMCRWIIETLKQHHDSAIFEGEAPSPVERSLHQQWSRYSSQGCACHHKSSLFQVWNYQHSSNSRVRKIYHAESTFEFVGIGFSTPKAYPSKSQAHPIEQLTAPCAHTYPPRRTKEPSPSNDPTDRPHQTH